MFKRLKYFKQFRRYEIKTVYRSSSSGVIKSPYKNYTIKHERVTDCVWSGLELWSEKIAITCGISGRDYKYAELRKFSRNFAAGLRSRLDAREDDCLAIMLPNSPEFAIAMLATLEAGCIVTTLNPMYTKDEVKRQLLMSESKFLVTTSALYAKVASSLKDVAIKVIVVKQPEEDLPQGTIKFTDLSEDFSIDSDILKGVVRGLEDVAFLPYSSGTTGLPKGVELTHKNVLAAIGMMTSDEEINFTAPTTSSFQDSLLAIIPFYHIFGLSCLLTARLASGCRLITVPQFTPEAFIKLQEQYRTSVLFTAPPLALFLANHPAVTTDHLAPVRNLLIGGAPIADTDIVKLAEKSKNDNLNLVQGHGMTESVGVAFLPPLKKRNFASVGHPFPCSEAKVVATADSKAPVGPGENGELWLRGEHILKGYKNNPEANAEVFTEDGWLKTGDIVRYDKDNNFYVVDRLKELIKVKAFQVAPAELEAVLRDHPAVLDAAVVGVPHATHGETPKAFVVLKKGQSASEEAIKAFLDEKVAPFKRLGYVQFINEVPKSASGKILRKDLKNMYCN